MIDVDRKALRIAEEILALPLDWPEYRKKASIQVIIARELAVARRSACQCRDCGKPLDASHILSQPRSCIICDPEFGEPRGGA